MILMQKQMKFLLLINLWSNYAFMQHAESGNLIFGFYLNHEILQPNPSNANKTNISVDWTS